MADEKTTKEETPKPPRITWKVVESRHVTRAQERKKESKEAYTNYVLSLVERFNDTLVGLPSLPNGELPIGAVQLNKEQVAQTLAAFEAKFGGSSGD